MDKIELLAPAGDAEKLRVAVDYGADAVYFGGAGFSLRAAAGNFTADEMKEGVKYAHDHGVKVYMTINIFAHNDDIAKLPDFLDSIADIDIDGFLVSDPGVMMILREKRPGAEIHLSTQANTTNYLTARYWHDQGVKRIVAAREMTLKELEEFKRNLPDDMEIEVFVHGAMCMSYSGRCLLSNYMTGRDANRGMCAHPCRYHYALVEEKRPGEYFPVEEDDRGSYILNSKDLCMIEHMPDLIKLGITSAKIEGRMKSVFYLASVVRVYREAIDTYYRDPEHYKFNPDWLTELSKASHRRFSTGFFYGKPGAEAQNYESSAYIREYAFIGIVKSYDGGTHTAVIEQRNNFRVGDEIEIFGPGSAGFFTQKVEDLRDEDGVKIDVAPHPQQIVSMPVKYPVAPGYMLRRRNIED
ncbi:MAG: peptidase U32 family protein [Anaerovoracaceae bacterium]